MNKLIFAFFTFLVVSGCATTYQKTGFTGGHEAEHLEGNIYRIYFGGNGYTTRETVQTYWLYKCAEYTIEKGFDGFEILSNIQLTKHIPVEEFFLPESDVKIQQAQMVFIPVDSMPKPQIEADIKMMKSPLNGQPPKVFDAKKLKEALEPFVTGEKCDMGNICKHVHKYIHPEGKFSDSL